MSVSKSDIINTISKNFPNLYKKDIIKFFDIFLFEITKALSNGERVELRDAVMFESRVQKERIKDNELLLQAEKYYQEYGLTTDRIKNCKKDVIVMHPGPMNRGIEIQNEVADGPNSVITEQVTNGIAARMAILSILEESTDPL